MAQFHLLHWRFFITKNEIKKRQLRATYQKIHKDAGTILFDSLNKVGFKASKASRYVTTYSIQPIITFMESDNLTIEQIALLEKIYESILWEALAAQNYKFLDPGIEKMAFAKNFSQVVARTFHILCRQKKLDQKIILDQTLKPAFDALEFAKALQQTATTKISNCEEIYNEFFNNIYSSIKPHVITKEEVQNIATEIMTTLKLTNSVNITDLAPECLAHPAP